MLPWAVGVRGEEMGAVCRVWCCPLTGRLQHCVKWCTAGCCSAAGRRPTPHHNLPSGGPTLNTGASLAHSAINIITVSPLIFFSFSYCSGGNSIHPSPIFTAKSPRKHEEHQNIESPVARPLMDLSVDLCWPNPLPEQWHFIPGWRRPGQTLTLCRAGWIWNSAPPHLSLSVCQHVQTQVWRDTSAFITTKLV